MKWREVMPRKGSAPALLSQVIPVQRAHQVFGLNEADGLSGTWERVGPGYSGVNAWQVVSLDGCAGKFKSQDWIFSPK